MISFFHCSCQAILAPSKRQETGMTIETEESAGRRADAGRWRLASGGLVAALKHWLEKRRTRRNLLELSVSELSDIGMTREAARAEVRKSWFWD
jgi:uncharacterized protein YjiS (DUF1127 family)